MADGRSLFCLRSRCRFLKRFRLECRSLACSLATRPLAEDGAANLSAMRDAATAFGKPQRHLLFWYYRVACPPPPVSAMQLAVAEVVTSGAASGSATALTSTGDGGTLLAMAECLPQKDASQTCEASEDVRRAIRRRFSFCNQKDAAVVDALLKAKVPFKLKPNAIFFEQIPMGVTIPQLPAGVSLEDYRATEEDKAEFRAQESIQKKDTGGSIQVSASASATASPDMPHGR